MQSKTALLTTAVLAALTGLRVRSNLANPRADVATAQRTSALIRASVLALCLVGCILGCSRQVEVVDSAEQKAEREKAKKHFDNIHYADLRPLGEPEPKKETDENSSPEAPKQNGK